MDRQANGNWRKSKLQQKILFASSTTWWPKLEPMQVAPPGWPHLQAMQVTPSGGQIYNQCKWSHIGTIYKLHNLLVKLRTGTSDATFKLISVRKMI